MILGRFFRPGVQRLVEVIGACIFALVLLSSVSFFSAGRMIGFTDVIMEQHIPELRRSYELQLASNELTKSSIEFLASESTEELFKNLQAVATAIEGLERITAELSVAGEFADVVELNVLSQSLEQRANAILATRILAEDRSSSTASFAGSRTFTPADSFQNDIDEIAQLAAEHRHKLDLQMTEDQNLYLERQSAFRLLSLVGPLLVLAFFLIIATRLVRNFSRKMSEIRRFFLGELTRLPDWFDDERDEASELGRAAQKFAQTRKELQKSLEQKAITANNLARLIDTASTPIFGIQNGSAITTWNKSIAGLTGFPAVIAKGEINLDQLICQSDFDAVSAAILATKSGDPVNDLEFSIVRKDGTLMSVLGNFTRYGNAVGAEAEVICIANDLTTRNELQAQAIQASKLATLGEMATGLAHEINQPLNAMRLAVATGRRKLDSPNASFQSFSQSLNLIESQVVRAASIVDHMRVFGRKADQDKSDIDITQCVRISCGMMQEQIRLAGIELNFSAQDPILVSGHAVLMEQVLVNILMNAKFELQNRDVMDPRIRVSVESTDTEAVIVISDNAGGIPDAVITKIFEPFFTTKPVGSGTGLGLSISYGIIQDMKGSMKAYNDAQGAVFEIRLPLKSAEIDDLDGENEEQQQDLFSMPKRVLHS